MKTDDRYTWKAMDLAFGTAVLLFVALLSLFPIRNNDIWWHLAVGQILAGGTFITQDPFMFSVPGLPWVPHAWISSLVFFLVHTLAGETGLVVLRALIVSAVFWVVLRIIRRLEAPLTIAAPLLMVAILNGHSRFILRPHLFEYLFIVLLLWHMLRPSGKAASFFALPLVIQLLWVNMHASFYLGPAVVALYYGGEALAARFPKRFVAIVRRAAPIPWRRPALLVLLMAAISLVNPRPLEFVLQPLGAEQRELLTRYTLEWQSPFAPLARGAVFHPYYEVLLGFLALTLVLSVRRLKPAAWLPIIFFALLSFEAHRFRVELALLGVPLALAQLNGVPIVGRISRRLRKRPSTVPAVALGLCVLLVATSPARVELGQAVSDRFPKDALAFAAEHGVARRSFHTVGFGSYLIWEWFPDGRSFVDGRNIDAEIYRDFLACQTNSAGFNGVIRKYELDAFVIPTPEKSDGGMRNVHHFLIESKGWTLVHLDRNAYVYVRNVTVDDAWLERYGYRRYHPLTFGQARFAADELTGLQRELERAASEDTRYARVGLDAARFLAGIGRKQEALSALRRVIEANPENKEADALRRQLEGQ